MAAGVAVQEYIVIVHAQELIEDDLWFPDISAIAFWMSLYEFRVLINIFVYIVLVYGLYACKDVKTFRLLHDPVRLHVRCVGKCYEMNPGHDMIFTLVLS